VVAATVLFVGMPHRGRVPGWWIGPVLQLGLLGILIAQDRGRIDRRSVSLHRMMVASFTNATAFSPTDTLPVRRWAKLTMMVQAALSLVIAILVIARAINVLPG
jgi:hypothetical protein